ncbi:MAG: hypothetical protein WDO18_19795 [Acidobacteriota bacterium]
MRAFGAFLLCTASVFAADGGDLSPAKIDEIIKTFAANEAAFAEARSVYTYHQTARIQELDNSGRVTGRWETVSDIIFDRDAKRTERVTFAPVDSLKNIQLTPKI